MTAEEREAIFKIKNEAFKLAPAIDLSILPAITRDESERRVMIQLKEVLDRVDLPPEQEIPDAKMMKELGKTRWQIPRTEVAIQQIESGPRKGDYIFSADTIERLSGMYEIAKSLPYVTRTTENWYERQIQYPIGPMFSLAKFIPSRWILNDVTIASSNILFLHQPLWRWFGMLLVAGVVGLIAKSLLRWTARLQREREDPLGYLTLLRPFTVVILSAFSARVLGDVLRVSDAVFLTLIPTIWAIFFVALSWLFWNLGDVLAEAIIASEHMIKGSINSQLTRFLMRLITFCMVVATLVIGGQSLGLPAYSIIASIGVGGLAVALAAQHTLANLLASLIIMFEKPFVIGSRVNVGGQAGTVKSVGFRSTQIQADGGTVISIPNDKVISGPIQADNTRPQNHISATLRVPNITPVESIRAFVAQARDHLTSSANVKAPSVNVGVSGLTQDGVEVQLEFILSGPFGDRVAERKNEILLDLLDLGAKSGILNGEAVVRRN
jgi:MscS family membrane protein